MSLNIVRTVADLRAQVAQWRADGDAIALVPTMGALHQGHLALVKAAKARAQRVVVSLFVNPSQFNNAEDLAKYPRTEADDADKLRSVETDLLFAPPVEEMYPKTFSTTVSVGELTEGLCGAFRPGHFDGVATVVTKLLLQAQADLAFFGEKDFQQLAVITRLARDLDIPVEIVGVPTVREADGLALSSRNVRLGPEARGSAPALFAALDGARAEIEAGTAVEPATEAARRAILSAGFESVEYLELRGADGLEPLATLDRPARLLVAAWIDGVRLIDNIAVIPKL